MQKSTGRGQSTLNFYEIYMKYFFVMSFACLFNMVQSNLMFKQESKKYEEIWWKSAMGNRKSKNKNVTLGNKMYTGFI